MMETVRYDVIQEFNLAHVAKNKKIQKEETETKTSKYQCPLSSVQVQDP